MVSPAYGAGAFLQHATNFIARHFLKPPQVPIRPSRRPLPSAFATHRHREPVVSPPTSHSRDEHGPQPVHTSDQPRRRRRRAHKLNRSKSRLAAPAVKKAIRTEHRRREATVDTLLRKQRAAWRRLGPKDSEEAIVWKNFQALQFDKVKRMAIAEQEEISERVKANAGRRMEEMAHRNDLADQILRMAALMREERQEKARKQKERAAREEFERVVRAREAVERAEQEAKERSEREARERFEQQLRERAEELARERAEQEARIRAERLRQAEEIRLQNERHDRIRREKLERQRKEDEEKQRVYEESLRKLRETLDNCFVTGEQLQTQIDEEFRVYNRKWEVLKTGIDANGADIPPLSFFQIPWPILLSNPSQPAEITRERIWEFMFHPLRNGGDGKAKRSIIRQEMVRWHPDKFNTMVLVRVKMEERDAVAEGAGEVARLFNAIMNEL